jgi:lycopene beta-cyclase
VDPDYLIVGAGCAGLSLAVHLLETQRAGLRVAVLDPRTDFGRDRTWCFFRTMDHPFARCVDRAWTRWRIVQGARDVIRGSEDHPYQHLPADAFYAHALGRVRASGAVSLHLGARVHALVDEGDLVVAETDLGRIRARLAFDSRPTPCLAAEPGAPSFLQCFVGWFVQAARPVFDAATATLMDFRVDQARGIHFMYVLPFSQREALVEDTYFCVRAPGEDRHAAALGDYLDRLGVGDYSITRRERGVLPMSAREVPPRPSPRVYRIGLAGGLAKPSTGFAFLAIQRFSSALAARLHREDLPAPPAVRPLRTRMLDRVFLSYLARRPDEAPDLFARLFERVPAEVLVRFLSECGTIADDIRVMAALPAAPFAREAIRSG